MTNDGDRPDTYMASLDDENTFIPSILMPQI